MSVYKNTKDKKEIRNLHVTEALVNNSCWEQNKIQNTPRNSIQHVTFTIRTDTIGHEKLMNAAGSGGGEDKAMSTSKTNL